MINAQNDFPQEFYLQINNNDNLEGRITLIKVGQLFSTEIDIVFCESKKIFKHVTRLDKIEDKQEAIDQSVMELSFFLNTFKTSI